MVDDNKIVQMLRSGRLRRRALLKAAGVSIGASAVGAGNAAASSVADGPEVNTYSAVTLNPNNLPEADPPDDPSIPDIDGPGGSAEARETPLRRPSASGRTGGPAGNQRLTRGGSDVIVGANFDGLGTRDVVRGLDFDDSGVVEDDEIFFLVPSDAQLGVGPNDVVTSINSEVGFFDKTTGDRLAHFRLEHWFENVLSIEQIPSQFENVQVFDPRVRFDPGSGRFIIACVEFNLPDMTPDGPDNDDGPDPVEDVEDLVGAYLLSISDTSNPMGTWTNYRIPPLPATRLNTGLVDFPQLGYGPNAVYLTQNFFDLTPSGFEFGGVTMSVLNKRDLLAGRSVTALQFENLRNPDGSPAFTVQPAKQTETPTGFHLMNTRFFQGKSLTVWMVDTADNPTAESDVSVSNAAVGVKPYHNSPDAQQPETEEKIDTGDTRIVDAVAYDETTGHLWAAHTINGRAARWYEVDPSGPTVVQSASFERKGKATFYPVVEATDGEMMMVYSVASPDNDKTDPGYAGIEVAGRTSDTPAGALDDFAVVKEGESKYDYVNDGEGDPGAQTVRWGDYNGIQVDPDGTSYWVISQYASEPDTQQTFNTRIANVELS